MLDHIFFSVIYAVPNLAFHSEAGEGYGLGSEKCERIMENKLQMQKTVYIEKHNLLKSIFSVLSSGSPLLTEEEFRQSLSMYDILNTH